MGKVCKMYNNTHLDAWTILQYFVNPLRHYQRRLSDKATAAWYVPWFLCLLKMSDYLSIPMPTFQRHSSNAEERGTHGEA